MKLRLHCQHYNPVLAQDYGNNYKKEEDDDCKVEYDALPQELKDKYGYEYELFVFLEQLVRKCDAKVQSNKRRLDEEMLSKEGTVTEEDVARLGELNEKINALTEKAEALGEEVSPLSPFLLSPLSPLSLCLSLSRLESLCSSMSALSFREK